MFVKNFKTKKARCEQRASINKYLIKCYIMACFTAESVELRHDQI